MRHLIPNLCFVVGLAAVAAAGTATPTAKSVTVTGCLREVADKPGSFVLIREASAAATSDERTKPTLSATEPALYRLSQGIGVELGPHVGRQLQVNGSITKTADRAQASLPQGKVAASVSSADAMGAPELSVASFQVVAQSCQPAAK